MHQLPTYIWSYLLFAF